MTVQQAIKELEQAQTRAREHRHAKHMPMKLRAFYDGEDSGLALALEYLRRIAPADGGNDDQDDTSCERPGNDMRLENIS